MSEPASEPQRRVTTEPERRATTEPQRRAPPEASDERRLRATQIVFFQHVSVSNVTSQQFLTIYLLLALLCACASHLFAGPKAVVQSC